MSILPKKARPRWNTRKRSSRKAFKGVQRTESPNERQYKSKLWTSESKDFRRGKTCANPTDNPRCKGTPDTVDHVRNAATTSAEFWDKTNWMVLCRSCHAVKSNKERAKQRKVK